MSSFFLNFLKKIHSIAGEYKFSRKEEIIEKKSDIEFFDVVNNQLAADQEIKNYKELCEILDLPVVGGKQKQLQLNNLGRFCLLDKKGIKYIVKEIYESPIEKQDKRTAGNRAIFVKYIEAILLNYFIQQDQIRCNFTKKQLWTILGMINENFNLYYEKKLSIDQLKAIDYRINKWQVDNFYSRTRNKLIDITKSALNSLQKRSLIEWSWVYVARRTRPDGRLDWFEVQKDWQIQKILECKTEALMELNCKELKDVIYNKDKNINIDSYNKIFNRILNKKLGWDFVFRRYSVICNKKYLEAGLKENERDLKQFLNKKVIEVIDEQADYFLEKNKEDLKNGKTEFRYPTYYPQIQRILSERFLNLNAEQIDDFLKDIEELEELFGGNAS